MKRLTAALAVVTPILLAVGQVWADEAKSVPDGKPIFLKYKCTSCHSIEAQGLTKVVQASEGTAEEKSSTRKPPDLSGAGLEHQAGWMKLYLTKKETIKDRKHMKLFRGSEEELLALTGWLESLKKRKGAKDTKTAEKTEK